ncbi:MAG: glutamate mutase L [Chloroflexales bacterium]|nr:glutamate mutase L [Chloroflexales bacterium]
MAETIGAVLIAEVGCITTRVTLVDIVDGESRVIGRAETLSSIEPPYRNALFGILEAAAHISEATGRVLLREGQLLMPQTNERDGVNHLVAVSSAAGSLSLVITAIAGDVSARSALHAARSTYTAVLQVVTLDDAAVHPVSGDNRSWIERQVQALLESQPDVVLMAGGLEGGAVDALIRLAHIVGLTLQHPNLDQSGQPRFEAVARPVIYAGNSDAREKILEVLADRAPLFVVDNVRPTLDQERLEPASLELQRIYDEQVLVRLPGMTALRRFCKTPVATVCRTTGLLTRFIAERQSRRVLTLDVGAMSSSAFLAAPGAYMLAVLGVCGVGYGLSTILTQRGLDNVARWLPFPITATDLTSWMLNKLLRPQVIPTNREDLLIEHAITCEALAMALEALYDEVAAPEYDMVLACGGVLAHAPRPGLAALTVLDALQITTANGAAASSIPSLLHMHLDVLGLAPACGGLAMLDADAAVTLFDRDLMRNMPLATCVITLGDGRPGDVAVEAKLQVLGGHTQELKVLHGQIARLPLDQGAKGQLTLRPASGVRIGNNPPGVEVSSNLTEISGSALGVVIDARGWPLQLPQDERQRCLQIWEWLVALGVERGKNPYIDMLEAEHRNREQAAFVDASSSRNGSVVPVGDSTEMAGVEILPGAQIELDQLLSSPPAEAMPETGRLQPGKRISLDDLAAQQPPPPPRERDAPPDAIQSDLDKLRQTFEEPQKRGWFGRKKS